MRGAGAPAGGGHLRALGVAALGVAYIVLVPWLGFAPAIALLLFAAMLYYGAPLGFATVLQSLLGAAALWTVFALALGRAA